MKKIISAVMMAAVVLNTGVNCVLAKKSSITEIYVSLNGSDSNPGTIEQPLKTATAARDKIRSLKNSGEIGEDGAVVYFRGGIYPFSEPLDLSEQDSGTAEAPITYRSYLDEEVSFIGGVNIDPASFELVTDQDILGRIIKKDIEGSLYRVNLKAVGVDEIPMPYLLGNYSYWQVEGIASEKSIILGDLTAALGYDPESAKSPELFVDDELMTVSRYPNESDGYLKVEAVTEAGPFMRNWNDDIIGADNWVPPEERVPTPFRFINKTVSDRMEYWKNANQALLWGRWYWDWATQSVPLDYVVPVTGEIASKLPGAFSVRIGQPWYIYNLLEEIDEPGEYFMDRDSGYLYLYPKKDIKSVKEVVLTLLDESIIYSDGASYINFKGIDVGRSRRHAFHVLNADNFHISDSEISYTAESAVLVENSMNSTVKHSYIHDVDGGVSFTDCGNMAELIPGNCSIENCEFERFARLTKTYTNAAHVSGCGNYIRYNEIHDTPHQAVAFNGPNHEISFNNIYDVCQEADDSGVIYVGRNLVTHYGCVVKNNYIHDCTPKVDFDYGVAAVYLDDMLSGVTVAGNIIENLQYGGKFSGYNNIFVNNIFINNTAGDVLSVMDTGIVTNTMQPTLLAGWKEATYKDNEAWKKAFPNLQRLTEENYTNDTIATGNIVANNYSWNSVGLKLGQNMAACPENIIENNVSSTKDPGFVNAADKIYMLKEDAQIYKDIPDFKSIPFTRIGQYDERAMARIDDALALIIDSPYVFVNGRKDMINTDEPEQMPVIINNSTYVPFRFLGEALGMKVEFDDATRIAEFEGDGYTLNFSLDSLDKITKNGEEVTLEVPLKVINGRTYMPLRAISEMIDKEVFWDNRGFITVSDTENLFVSEADEGLIDYIYGKLSIY